MWSYVIAHLIVNSITTFFIISLSAVIRGQVIFDLKLIIPCVIGCIITTFAIYALGYENVEYYDNDYYP